MISDLQQLSTRTRDLRKFGLVVGGVFLLLGGWFLFRNKPAGPYFLTPGVLLVVFGLVAPRSLKIAYICLDESGLYYGSTCLHGGPHDLLLSGHHPYRDWGAIIWQGLPFRKTRSQREELLAGA
jgi:hypothetical protein